MSQKYFVRSKSDNQMYAPELKKPYILGYMSVNEKREYHSNLSQLKFVNNIPGGKIHLDLNHNIDKAVKRTTDDNNEKIDLLLKFLLEHHHRLNFIKPTFITYRRTLISVMCSAFGNPEPLCIKSSYYNNCIYLCSVETEKDKQRRLSRNKKEDKFCAWGYKFEQYLLSDSPNVQPNINKPVVENEEFSLFYYSELGKHRLFYGAQIDGLLATHESVTDLPITEDVETNLKYLRNNSYVELKTNRELQYGKQEQNYKRHKLLRCWCQCYLAGLAGLIVGFRNDDGIVQRLQWYETSELVQYCKYEWNPATALNYLNYFLTYVEDSFYKAARHNPRDEPINLEFYIDMHRNITLAQDNSEVVILPEWFINKLQ